MGDGIVVVAVVAIVVVLVVAVVGQLIHYLVFKRTLI